MSALEREVFPKSFWSQVANSGTGKEAPSVHLSLCHRSRAVKLKFECILCLQLGNSHPKWPPVLYRASGDKLSNGHLCSKRKLLSSVWYFHKNSLLHVWWFSVKFTTDWCYQDHLPLGQTSLPHPPRDRQLRSSSFLKSDILLNLSDANNNCYFSFLFWCLPFLPSADVVTVMTSWQYKAWKI